MYNILTSVIIIIMLIMIMIIMIIIIITIIISSTFNNFQEELSSALRRLGAEQVERGKDKTCMILYWYWYWYCIGMVWYCIVLYGKASGHKT